MESNVGEGTGCEHSPKEKTRTGKLGSGLVGDGVIVPYDRRKHAKQCICAVFSFLYVLDQVVQCLLTIEDSFDFRSLVREHMASMAVDLAVAAVGDRLS